MIDLSKPSDRGYFVLYRPNEVNRCPACARSNWYVGRFSAECGFCAAAVPLVKGEDHQLWAAAA